MEQKLLRFKEICVTISASEPNVLSHEVWIFLHWKFLKIVLLVLKTSILSKLSTGFIITADIPSRFDLLYYSSHVNEDGASTLTIDTRSETPVDILNQPPLQNLIQTK